MNRNLLYKFFFPTLGILFAVCNISCNQLPNNENYTSEKSCTNDQSYTGFWTSSDGREQGFYKNGIPIGTWIDYYPNGQIASQRQYDGINKYVGMEYYPDGMICEITRGTYSFDGNDLSETSKFSQYYDAEGNPFTCETEQNSTEKCDYRWETDIIVPFSRLVHTIKKKDIAFYCYLILLKNNKYYLWYYSQPQNGIYPASKVIMQGQLTGSPVSFEVNQIKHILSNDKVRVKSAFDNPILKVIIEIDNPIFGTECFDFEIELKEIRKV